MLVGALADAGANREAIVAAIASLETGAAVGEFEDDVMPALQRVEDMLHDIVVAGHFGEQETLAVFNQAMQLALQGQRTLKS